MSEQCRPVLDDQGQLIATVLGTGELSPAAGTAMRALVGAAQRRMAEDPDLAAILDRQAAGRERIRARNARLRGTSTPP